MIKQERLNRMALVKKTEPNTDEITILGRILSNGKEFSPAVARQLLKLGFCDEDKARMHELAVVIGVAREPTLIHRKIPPRTLLDGRYEQIIDSMSRRANLRGRKVLFGRSSIRLVQISRD